MGLDSMRGWKGKEVRYRKDGGIERRTKKTRCAGEKAKEEKVEM